MIDDDLDGIAGNMVFEEGDEYGPIFCELALDGYNSYKEGSQGDH